jgi:hypothetical protein
LPLLYSFEIRGMAQHEDDLTRRFVWTKELERDLYPEPTPEQLSRRRSALIAAVKFWKQREAVAANRRQSALMAVIEKMIGKPRAQRGELGEKPPPAAGERVIPS